MVLKQVAKAAKKIPWKDILEHIPKIIDSASKLIGFVKKENEVQPGGKSNEEQLKQLSEKIKLMVGNDSQQANVIKQISEQLQRLAETVQIVSIRASIAMWSSIILVIILAIVVINYFLN